MDLNLQNAQIKQALKAEINSILSCEKFPALRSFYLSVKRQLFTTLSACAVLSSYLIMDQPDYLETAASAVTTTIEDGIKVLIGAIPFVGPSLQAAEDWIVSGVKAGTSAMYKLHKYKRFANVVRVLTDHGEIDIVVRKTALHLTKMLEWHLLQPSFNKKIQTAENLGCCMTGILLAHVMDGQIKAKDPENFALELALTPFTNSRSSLQHLKHLVNMIMDLNISAYGRVQKLVNNVGLHIHADGEDRFFSADGSVPKSGYLEGNQSVLKLLGFTRIAPHKTTGCDNFLGGATDGVIKRIENNKNNSKLFTKFMKDLRERQLKDKQKRKKLKARLFVLEKANEDQESKSPRSNKQV